VRNEGEIGAIERDDSFKGGDYTSEPVKGIEEFSLMWTGWLYSREWWRQELWRTINPPGATFEQVVADYTKNFIPGADANNLILQMRTWEKNDAGATPGFGGDEKKALASIKVPVLFMPSATDLYFPVTDAQYEAQFIPRVTLMPIPSLWGHPAGAGACPADEKFLNEAIAKFMDGK
jgi:homoserine O-acetyltransferase